MRFRIIFDNGLVCSRFMKSWFILDQESCATSEVLSQISSFFSIRDSFHAELDGFVIPDSQLFDKIVKEGEIVNIKKGPFTLFPRQDEFLKKPFNKHIKKLVKKEQEDSSESEPLKKPVKRIKKPFIEESSDSSSSESIVKPVRKKPEPKIPIKSLLVKQPEPEFRAKNLLVKQPEFRAQKDTGFDLQEFKTCAYDEIFPGDEILFKTLELRDDNTPGMSDFKVLSK